MTTDYNPIAEQYQRSKQQPWRSFIECFTLMDLIGDPTGRSVLDMFAVRGSTPDCCGTEVRRGCAD